MFRNRILFVILFLVLALGLFSLGGYIGWSQGYASGTVAAAAAGDGGELVAPRPFYGGGFYPWPYYGPRFFPIFFGFGLFFKFAFFIFFIFLISRFFGFWGWRMAGGPPGYWRGHRWGHHGPPPWYDEGKEAAEQESPIPPEPDDRER
jgi:hypothetical protein